MPAEFWLATEAMKAALADRHIGRVIRAFRTHPHHGRHRLAQETAARWFGLTQSALSRIETGSRIDQLDQLIHWATVLRIPREHLWFTLPDDHQAALEAATNHVGERAAAGLQTLPQELGEGSSARTKILLAAVDAGSGSRLRYLPPIGATESLRDFLGSSSRAFVIKGPPGCGKTSLMYYLARDLEGDADFQLHSVDSWDMRNLDMAAEILRYASIPRGDDPLLTLERVSAALSKPCLVVIDGVKGQEHFGEIGRQLDGILRQVTTPTLRCLVVIRTPPDIELSAFPVLAASVYEPLGGERGTSYRMSAWETTEAREVWNHSRTDDEPAFADLPPSIQQLARLPVYMQLLKAAGHSTSPGEVDPYHLVDFCVQSVLHAAGRDVERTVDELAEVARREVPDLVPSQLISLTAGPPGAEADLQIPKPAVPPLTRVTPTGRSVFDHDVIREYLLATLIANLMAERGRSIATVGAFNDLAIHAAASATARGVFEFVVHCLDRRAVDLLTAVTLAPTVSTTATLPLMLNLAANGARFATPDVLRVCADRCSHDSALELARSLLAIPTMTTALGDEHAAWLIELLRTFGSAIWPDVMTTVEQILDGQAAHRLLASANLDEADEATFFARYFFLYFGDQDTTGTLEALLGHPDWRVRAALAEGVRDERSPSTTVTQEIVDRLVQDADYKVRAAVARAIGPAAPRRAERYLGMLLRDDNWHVRECVLQGLMSGAIAPSAQGLARAAITMLTTDSSWRQCPAHVRPLMERLLLLHATSSADPDSRGGQHALFALLREMRTGWLRPPDNTREALVTQARASQNWLVRREADVITEPAQRLEQRGASQDVRVQREQYRRLRDQRSVQVALDLHDLDQAIAVASATADAGVDFIEVGDPLIKKLGLAAVEQVKRHVPHAAVVAEMMSADWGRGQVEQAAEAGADVVLLIGPATTASVSAAVEAGLRLGIPILLDVPAAHAGERWIREMERAGVDGFAVTTNIDLGVRGSRPLMQARAIRGWTRLPVAVSGGFTASDYSIIRSTDWDILIIGRSITEAVHPNVAAKQLAALVHETGSQTRGTG